MSYLEIVILAVLSKKDRHGYEIKKVFETIFGNMITINNNSLYTYLHRFERMGAVVSESEHVEGKPDRLVYRLTDKGREILRDMVMDYTPDIARNDYEFFSRVTFFSLLEPGERLRILGTRRKALQGQVSLFEGFGNSRRLDVGGGFDVKMIQFLISQTRNEIDWIASMENEYWESEMNGTE